MITVKLFYWCML